MQKYLHFIYKILIFVNLTLLDLIIVIGDNFVMQSNEQIKNTILANKIKTIYLHFTDINGKVKYVTMPSDQINAILNGDILFDGSFIGDERENHTLDLKLIPDKSTFLVLPSKLFNNQATARFICDIFDTNGNPFVGCVRSNLKRIKEIATEQNYKMQVAPEVEFFLFETNKNGEILYAEKENTGYYDLNPSDKYNRAMLDILNTLQEIGFEVDAFHHEGAPFQHEIDLGKDDILLTADKLITFKFVVKTIATKYAYKATFMPKPLYGQNGSGLHLNLSLTNLNGENLLYDKASNNQLSPYALYSIGSILKNIKGITAILNPTINSYKRLVRDYEAPIYIAWSIINRSALIRIPATRGEQTKIELRSPDFATNPYLALAVIFQNCIDGIRNKVDPPTPIEKNLFQISLNEIKQRKIKSLPRNLFTALEEFEKSYVAKAALGEYIFEKFLSNKRQEWNEYRKQVTPWEVKNYLDI